MARTKQRALKSKGPPPTRIAIVRAARKSPIITGRHNKIRAAPPDLTVVVGSGDNREEFECYKIAMCFVCPYFDGET